MLRGLQQQLRQSETAAPGQRVVTRALQRLFEKANGGERWQPIDNRPEEASPADEDEDGFDDPDNAGPAGTQSDCPSPSTLPVSTSSSA